MPKKAITPAALARLRLAALRDGEDPRPALVAAINAGLPDLLHDPDCRQLLIDVVSSAPPPHRGKGRPERPRPWTTAGARAELQDREIAARVKHWHMRWKSDQKAALQDLIEMSEQLRRPLNRLFLTQSTKPFDKAAHTVGWELQLTAAAVKRSVTRAARRTPSTKPPAGRTQ